MTCEIQLAREHLLEALHDAINAQHGNIIIPLNFCDLPDENSDLLAEASDLEALANDAADMYRGLADQIRSCAAFLRAQGTAR